MTYKEFLDIYDYAIDVLEVYDRNGIEIPCDVAVPEDAEVLGYSRTSGTFVVDVDFECTVEEQNGQ